MVASEKGEVLLRGVGTLRYFVSANASVQWQPNGLTIHAKKWFLGAGFLGAPPISLSMVAQRALRDQLPGFSSTFAVAPAAQVSRHGAASVVTHPATSPLSNKGFAIPRFVRVSFPTVVFSYFLHIR